MLKREWPIKLSLEVGGEKISFHVRSPVIGDLVSSFQAGVVGSTVDPAAIQIDFALNVITDVEGVGYQDDNGKWFILNNKVEGWKGILSATCPDVLLAIAAKYHSFLKPKKVEGEVLFFGHSEPTSPEK